MQTVSKALAAFLSSLVALLVSFGILEPQLADALGEDFAIGVASIILAVLSALGVWAAPRNTDG